MIGRNRYVKPELFKHRLLRRLQRVFKINFRFCYEGLWLYTDREGRFEWNPEALQDEIDPDQFEGEDFAVVLNVLANAGFIVKYQAEGRFYGWIPRWPQHQAINGRETPSRLPPPPPSAYADYEARLAAARNAPTVVDETLKGEPSVSACNSSESTRADASSPDLTDGIQASHVGLSTSLSSRLSSTTVLEGQSDSRARALALPAVRGDRSSLALLRRSVEVFRQINDGSRNHLSREQEYQLKAEMIFIYWTAKFDHQGARIDAKRTARIIARLKENEADVSEILYALDGAHADDYIMARNAESAHRKYDGIETVLRDRGQIERFAGTRKGYREDKIHPMIPKLEAAMREDADGPQVTLPESDPGST